MYVTRPLSLYKRSPESLSLQSPVGPNSGYLALFDDESETPTCFGMCKGKSSNNLPFPQNKDLTVLATINNGGNVKLTFYDGFLFIPVINQPLASNRYYIIHRQGKYKGLACTSSKDEDKGSFCGFTYTRDVEPKPFDPSDTYQQFEIIYERFLGLWGFFAKSVAPDGYPSALLRNKYWGIYMREPCNYQLDEALGLNDLLRSTLPKLNFSLGREVSDALVVGKWYCPFLFVKEHNVKLDDQMKISTFYEVTLEQRWDKIYGCDNKDKSKRVVQIDVVVEREEVFLSSKKAIRDEQNLEKGMVWFKSCDGGKDELLVGLRTQVVERMKWEQERGDWVDGNEEQVRVERREEFEGSSSGWTKFGCYALVERFVFKRMDKSGILAYDFKHTNQIKCLWE